MHGVCLGARPQDKGVGYTCVTQLEGGQQSYKIEVHDFWKAPFSVLRE
jgi:hypothetical protein